MVRKRVVETVSGFDEFSVSCDPMGLQITAVKKNGETSLDQGE